MRSLRLDQFKVIVLLFAGYAACYFCRADLSVATPLLIEELGQPGISHAVAMVRVGESCHLESSPTPSVSYSLAGPR